MSEKFVVALVNPVQARKAIGEAWIWCKAMLTAGHRLKLVITLESRSSEQNRKFHAMIGEIAEQAQHLGCKWDAESWKRLLVSSYCREIGMSGGRVIPNLEGDGIVQLDFQTRKFTKEQASGFVEWLHAWGAQNGVEFSE